MTNNTEQYTNEEILNEFQDVIEDVIFEGIYKENNEKYVINLIKDILSLGVDRHNHGYILEIISKVDSIKNDTSRKRKIPINSSNKKLIKILLEEDYAKYHPKYISDLNEPIETYKQVTDKRKR